MTDKLQEIKDALAKITQGPWQYDCEGDMVWAGTTKNPQGHICDVRGFGENLPMNDNGDFIAKSPEYVEYLLAEVERETDNTKFLIGKVERLESDVTWYEQRIERLEAALRWYADEESHEIKTFTRGRNSDLGRYISSDYQEDLGMKAREALKDE